MGGFLFHFKAHKTLQMDALFPTDQPPVFSYWEIERYLSGIDLLIIGGGIVGLTTALYCKKHSPKLRITVMERGCLPSGASSKNAGFACFGSLGELLDDLRVQPEEMVLRRVADRVEGLSLLRSLLGDEGIGYEPCGGVELFTDDTEDRFSACKGMLYHMNRQLQELTGLAETYRIADGLPSSQGMNGIRHAILNRAEGAIDTGRMMSAITQKVRSMGIEILTGLGVSEVNDIGQSVAVRLENGHELRTGQVHVATNGFAAQLLPELDVRPARAQVLVTSPIEGLRIRGTFHLEDGYYYFRNVGDRVLLGGGRNLDPIGETTPETGLSEAIQHRLEELLRNVILPGTLHTVAHRWSGVMGMGGTKDTILQQLSPRMTCAVRLGGMGVALGTLIGKRSAELILK